jgi:hypothetical protein
MDQIPDSPFHEGRSFWTKVADAAQGFGAGFRGKGDEFFDSRDKQWETRRQALLEDARRTKMHLESGNVESAQKLLQNRLGAIQRLGGDPSDTAGILQQIQAGPEGIQQALRELDVLDQAAVANGKLPPVEKYVGAMRTGHAMVQTPSGIEARRPAGVSDEDWAAMQASSAGRPQFAGAQMMVGPDGRYYMATRVANPDGSVRVETAPVEEGLTPVDSLGLTAGQRPGQRAQENLAGSEATGLGAAKATRTADRIGVGVDAARGVPTLRRAMALIEEVNTGGPQKLMLMGKQLLGVESADEAELNNALGKAVLSQLKATFGAQFTNEEGQRLEALEAGFGKSTEGNRRILQQVYSLAEQKVKEAITAAQEIGDYSTVRELVRYMEMDLNPDQYMSDLGAFNAPQQPPARAMGDIPNLPGAQPQAQPRRLQYMGTK